MPDSCTATHDDVSGFTLTRCECQECEAARRLDLDKVIHRDGPQGPSMAGLDGLDPSYSDDWGRQPEPTILLAPSLWTRFRRWLAQDLIDRADVDGYLRGLKRGAVEAHAILREDMVDAEVSGYLAGITDGVALAVQAPGTPPKFPSRPAGLVIDRLLWKAIDRADMVARGGPDATTPDAAEGITQRADQLRAKRTA